MEIVLALIYGGAVGTLAHYTMPARDSRGPVLAPMLGAVTGGAVWAILTWAGVTPQSPWPWLAALILPAAAVFGGVAILTRMRAAHDTRERDRLRIV